ncbi:MAG TPA: cation diffusion facilitator family transporter, partial [Pseudorhodoplanes sp.]|nr:cation diffusion facilitator family transporter [Pseudorhodoplanes sp.]
MQQDKEKVALTSIAASGGLTIAKGVVGVMTGSLAILSEAAHSLLDFAATVMTYLAVRVSGKPADEEHHYGHGKFESVAALAETALLFLLSGIVIYEAIRRLLGQEHAVEATIPAFAVIGASIVIDFFRARALNKVARETSSEALEADALHFSSDLWSSLGVLIGLAAVALGFKWADAAAALVVAAVILIAGWRLGRRTIDTLLDAAPPGIADQVARIARRVPGVVAIDSVRARQVGPDQFVELNISVSRTAPIDRVAAMKDAVINAVCAELPKAKISVVTEPRALDNETIMDRVMVIARNRGLAVHHVTVHAIGEKLSVSLDLEVEGSLTLAAAHDIADGLEMAITDELGADVEVETHIEPLQPDAFGHDARAARIVEIQAALSDLATESGTLCDVHDVRVRETAEGEIINFHCRVDPSKTVHDVHEKVDDLERALRRKWPAIKRVIGHAEPLPTQP